MDGGTQNGSTYRKGSYPRDIGNKKTNQKRQFLLHTHVSRKWTDGWS